MIIMPRVKIDYVVSFSDEDPENQAGNLLSWEVSKKRWLCRAGQPSCSVVLQLARAVKISSLQIGVHHAALVEVLVGRSETPNEPYQVLVPRSVFMSPRESRGAATERVRSFSGAALGAPASERRWDRLRVLCSQPYNKHCQYGISFIQVFESESEAPSPSPACAPAPSPAVPPRMLALETFSSEDEEFSPGELFAKHRQSGAGGDTGAQIRQATSKALNNNSEAATKLVKTSLSKPRAPPPGAAPSPGPTAPAPSPGPTAPSPGPSAPSPGPTAPAPTARDQRDKDDLLYTKDDEQPHAKIDHIVQRHRDEKSKEEARTPKPKEKVKEPKDKTPRSSQEEPSSSKRSDSERDKADKKENHRRPDVNRKHMNNGSSSKNKDESRKRPHPDKNSADDEDNLMGPVCERPLSGVVFVMSGYQNPRRAALRALALSLGARAQADWGPACTHLICAFSNTPKLAAVRASAGGRGAPAPRAEWVEQCARRGRRLPWRWFACEPHLALTPPPDLHSDPPHPPESDADTDDEIEKVLRQNKKLRVSPPPASPPPAPPASPPGALADSDDDEVEFVKDERMQGSVTVEDSDSCDTDVEGEGGGGGAGGGEEGEGGALPALFSGQRFTVREASPLGARLLTRYVTAYGGLVIEPEEAEDGGDCLILCGGRGGGGGGRAGGRRVRGDWVWACHAARTMLPLHDYLIT